MKKQLILIALVALLVPAILLLHGSTTSIVTAAYPGGTNAPVSFKNDIQPILQSRCTKCHGGDFPSEGLNLESYEGLMAGSQNEPVVLAGDAGDSLLIDKIESGDMPKRGPKLTPEQIQTIRQWIDAGALNN